MKYVATACAIILGILFGLIVLYWLFPALIFMPLSRKLLSWGVSFEYQFVALCLSIFLTAFGAVLGIYRLLLGRFGGTARHARE